jgi:hypothetical protein
LEEQLKMKVELSSKEKGVKDRRIKELGIAASKTADEGAERARKIKMGFVTNDDRIKKAPIW